MDYYDDGLERPFFLYHLESTNSGDDDTIRTIKKKDGRFDSIVF